MFLNYSTYRCFRVTISLHLATQTLSALYVMSTTQYHVPNVRWSINHLIGHWSFPHHGIEIPKNPIKTNVANTFPVTYIKTIPTIIIIIMQDNGTKSIRITWYYPISSHPCSLQLYISTKSYAQDVVHILLEISHYRSMVSVSSHYGIKTSQIGTKPLQHMPTKDQHLLE